VITGEVSDAALRVLYQRCAAFAFPSLYEGFGLPLLEAMHCGAAVVAGNNSSQVEVVGEAGLLANASDAGDIAAKLARVPADGALACCDARLFARRAAVRDYHALVYQMGNSRYHRFLYEAMMRHPGVVTLHDFCLAGFHLIYGHRQGREREFLRAELLRWYP